VTRPTTLRRVALAAAVLAAGLVPAVAGPAVAGAAAPRVSVALVGPGGQVVAGPVVRTAPQTRVRVGVRTCRVPSATPLAALARLGRRVTVTGDGSCSASAFYVTGVDGRRARGREGWVYKVGTRAGTAGAADPSGPFGTGRRLRSGDRVLWFWCRLRAGGCQRTLAVTRVGRSTSRLRVVGHDDAGRARRVAGAVVTVRSRRTGRRASGRTNRRGEVTLRGMNASRGLVVSARRSGMVTAVPGLLR
jgi:hypothetical protein